MTEGKTKKIHQAPGGSDLVTVISKDDITAGDGAKHDLIPDKARFATATTCNVFRLLKACGLPVAFEAQEGATSFVAPKCSMLPYEVVIRREAHGSYLKRNPHLAKGQLFPQLIVEFFLKTKDRNWKGKPLICDDPLLIYKDGDFADPTVQPGKADAGAGAVPDPFDGRCLWPRRGVENLSRDAARRAPCFPRDRESLATRRRLTGRSEGRVRL